MRLTHEIIAAIAKAKNLKVGKIDLDAAILEGKDVFYWHTLNGVCYVRYQLVVSNPGTNILITADPAKYEGRIVEVGVSNWAFVEVGDMITDSATAFSKDTEMWLGEEIGCRLRLSVKAVLEET